jgi:phosphotransferase system enzyme I (PtsP)
MLVAQAAASALDNRPFQERERTPLSPAAIQQEESHLLLTLNDVSELVSQSHDLRTTLFNICDLIRHRFQSDVCSVYIRDSNNGDLVLKATFGLKPEAVEQIRMKIGEGLTGLVARRLLPVNESEAEKHPSFRFFPGVGEELYRSFLGVPMVQGGRAEGVLVVQHRDPKQYSPNQVSVLQGVASQLLTLIASAQLAERLREALAENRAPERPEPRRAGHRQPGQSASPGYGFGRAVRFEAFDFDHPRWVARIPDPIPEELERLELTLENTRRDIDHASRHLAELLGENFGAIMQAQRLMLEDNAVQHELRQAVRQGKSVEQAVVTAAERFLAVFRGMDNPFFQERIYDVKDLFRRALSRAGDHDRRERTEEDDVILVGHEVSLLELFSCDLTRVRGIAVERGGTHSHVAILARSLRIPMLTNAERLLEVADDGDEIFLDGHAGLMYVRPQGPHRTGLLKLLEHREVDAALDVPPETVPIRLEGTVNLLPEVERTARFNAAGIGLYRSEFLELARRAFPSEEEQVEVYSRMLTMLGGRPVTIRTMDLRSEKMHGPAAEGEGRGECWEWRLVDRLPHVQDTIRTQLRGILRSSDAGPIRVLFPMIVSRKQLDTALMLLRQAREGLKREGFTYANHVKVGVMVETPGAATLIRHWVRSPEVDFFGIGSNDLLHHLLGIERNDDELVRLKSPLDPVFLATVRHVVRFAKGAKKPVTVCGEAASNPRAALALHALGVDALSVPPDLLGPVRRAFASVHVPADLEAVARRLVTAEDTDQVEALLAKYFPARNADSK